SGEHCKALAKANRFSPLGSVSDRSPDYLLKGEDSLSNIAYHSRHDPRGSYPLISWVSAGCWMEAVEPYHRRAIDNWYDT
ncbi:hypothetical protein ACUOFC_64955, partial [Escherichia sp. TWPC-MK]